MRTLHKVWQTDRPLKRDSRRVQWYQNEDASSIRLKFMDATGDRNVFYYNDVEGAQHDWQEFINGASPAEIYLRRWSERVSDDH